MFLSRKYDRRGGLTLNTHETTLVILLFFLTACGAGNPPAITIEAAGEDAPAKGDFIPALPALGPEVFINLRDFGDLIRAERSRPGVEAKAPQETESFYAALNQSILQDPTLTSVTREYGPTVIPNQAFPQKSGTIAASTIPWSSWWYPRDEDYLFNDGNGRSPLSKYDLVRSSIKLASFGGSSAVGAVADAAAAFERKNYYAGSQPWEGLCDAWSLAAISKPEPKRPVTVSFRGGGSITFRISDLKALLFKTYEAVETTGIKYYGQRFTGDENGWIHPDIFPDQFHRFIEIQILQNRKPFVMDHDSGVEVWNVPVFKAKTVIDQVPNDPNAVFVRTWVATAESPSANEKEFLGTKEVLREYNYVLRGTRNDKGGLVVNSGYWVKGPTGVDSRRDHPDYFLQVPDPSQLVRKSWNPEIEVAIVDRILEKSY